jgi:hypothetical protein
MKQRLKNDVWTILWLMTMCVIAVSAHAQEPTAKIQPADTVAKAAILPQTTTIATGSASLDAPIIYPDPLPHVKMGLIAREYRACHAAVKKAVRVANDDAPIVAEEPKGEKQ